MKRYGWLMKTAAALVLTSAALYGVHFAFFGDFHHIFIYLVGDIAFVPLEVLLVVVIIERILSHREHQRLMQKLNMVIGTFFSELGTRLLGDLIGGIDNREELGEQLCVTADWSPQDYRSSLRAIRASELEVDVDRLDLEALRSALAEKRQMLVALLANPNLLEHDRFTNLLWAVFHLLEELEARDALDDLPESDRKHLQGDVRRVAALLTAEWLLYCRHLQAKYPYIFSIVVRTHPLQASPCATVT